MNQPDESSPLSPWPFVLADLILLSVAGLIGWQAHSPYSGAVVMGVGLLVAVGAAIAVLPFVLNHTWRQDRESAERQREIAALAQTLGAAAEQLSIAASGLHGVAENANKSLKQAELLPVKLQEKIHEFKEQLNEVSLTENEALSQEVNALRSAETERIESVVTTVRKLSGEFARLEAASRKNVTELSEALSRFTSSAEQAAVEATTSVAALRSDAEKSLASAHSSAMSAIEKTLNHALAEIDSKLTILGGQLTTKIDQAADVLDEKITALHQAGASLSPLETAHAKSSETEAIAADEPKPARKRTAPAKRIDVDPEFSLGLDAPETGAGEEFNQVAADDAHAAPAVSADGLTRLVVTAYIGIGNKLFVRGEGPGLSWEKGAPLQFVSIGKWRWETTDATEPVRLKIYKNDEQECTALGEVALEAGHQHEVTAMF